jgi:DNA-binding transcriptional LysR family regulator
MPANFTIDLLRSLEVFLGVADSGSMTKAARRLHITQSAISQHIKLLENDLGTRLIDRHHRPLRLTPAGVTLRQRAGRLLIQASEAVAETRAVAAGPLPHLRIAMFATLARTVVPAIVGAVAGGKLPVQNVSILRGMATDHARHLRNRDVEIALTSNALYDMEGIERHDLIEEHFVLVLPKKGVPPQAALREIAARYPMLRYSSRTESGPMIDRHLRRQRVNISSVFLFDAPEDLLRTAAKGGAWTIAAPTQVLHGFDDAAGVEFRALPAPGLSRTITLVARAGELGELPAQIAALCRRALLRDHLPRMRRLMPHLTHCFSVLDAGGSVSGTG